MLFVILATMKKSITNHPLAGVSKNNYIFLLFVLVAFFFWILINLSKNYEQHVVYNVAYHYLPKHKIFQADPPQNINLKVKQNGFKLLKNYLIKPEVNLSLKDVRSAGFYDAYLLNTDVYRQLEKQKINSGTLLSVLNDTLWFKVGRKATKKVPVILNADITYHPAYKSFTGLQLTPDSIIVSGPELQIDRITRVHVEKVNFKDVQENIVTTLKIIKPNLPKIDLDTQEVELNIEVEKITEKTLEIPIKVVNAPKDSHVVIYPKKIAVNFQVKLSEFNQVKAEDFSLIADFNKRQDKYISVYLEKQASLAEMVKVNTRKVEYLIVK